MNIISFYKKFAKDFLKRRFHSGSVCVVAYSPAHQLIYFPCSYGNPRHAGLETTILLLPVFSTFCGSSKFRFKHGRVEIQNKMTSQEPIQHKRGFLKNVQVRHQGFDFPVTFQNRKYLPNCFCCISDYQR